MLGGFWGTGFFACTETSDGVCETSFIEKVVVSFMLAFSNLNISLTICRDQMLLKKHEEVD